jgi:hypothetical protein
VLYKGGMGRTWLINYESWYVRVLPERASEEELCKYREVLESNCL